jgi:hypothetical protein
MICFLFRTYFSNGEAGSVPVLNCPPGSLFVDMYPYELFMDPTTLVIW